MKSIVVRAKDSDVANWDAAAESEGLNRTAWMRRALNVNARLTLDGAGVTEVVGPDVVVRRVDATKTITGPQIEKQVGELAEGLTESIGKAMKKSGKVFRAMIPITESPEFEERVRVHMTKYECNRTEAEKYIKEHT